MATVAMKPTAPHQQKMKRPPLPAVQTSIPPSQSSPSPSLSSKRPPSAFKAPPTPTMNGVSGAVNGVGPRISQRKRDSVKPGDIARNRNGKDIERRPVKRAPEPYVKTPDYILEKYRKKPVSLTLHLNPTNFRFDQQDGSFTYTQDMKMILEHLKKETIPHDMVGEFNSHGVKYYEGCLIVQVEDHRSTADIGASTNAPIKDSNVPFAIHNYSEYLTPSSYVPYPEHKSSSPRTRAQDDSDGTKSQPASQDKAKSKEPKTFTMVLFPTPLSMQEEIYIQANTPDVRSNNRKSSVAVPRTPASATVPPTPLTAIPPTPSINGPPAKRQKMMISGAEIAGLESKLISATAPPLFLDPVHDLEESYKLLDKLTDPLHRDHHPAPKTRKRTEAELAADEALAAQEQAFLLIMDERLGASSSTAKAGTNDEVGVAPFEPRFGRFNVIQQIKAQHEEQARHKERRDAEIKAQTIANKIRHDQEQRETNERRVQAMALEQQREIKMQQERQQREIRAQQAIQAQNAIHQNYTNGVLPNGVSQPNRSSPVVRNNTPHSNSSPVPGPNMVTHGGQNAPMNVTSTGPVNNTSSPVRPPSAMNHSHPPAGGVAMVHNRSRQRAPSRTSTPQAHSTPNTQHVTPVNGHATPVPRANQASPVNMMPNGMNHNSLVNGHLGGQPQVTPDQYQEMMLQRKQHEHYIRTQQHQAQRQQQMAIANGQMSPQERAALQQMHAQQNYQRSLASHHAAQNNAINAAHGHPNMPNGASPPQVAQNRMGPQPGQHPGQQPQPNPQNRMLAIAEASAWKQHLGELTQRYGNPNNIPQEALMVARDNSKKMAANHVRKMAVEAQQRQQMQRQNQQMAHHMQQLNAQNGGQMNMPNQMGGMPGMGGGQMSAGGGGGGPSQGHGMTREQMMAQMAQMNHLGGGGQGMQGMHGGMNGMNGGMQ